MNNFAPQMIKKWSPNVLSVYKSQITTTTTRKYKSIMAHACSSQPRGLCLYLATKVISLPNRLYNAHPTTLWTLHT